MYSVISSFFRAKRKEDYIKLVEFERNRIQLESLLQFKTKILEEQTNLQRKLQEKDKVAHFKMI